MLKKKTTKKQNVPTLVHWDVAHFAEASAALVGHDLKEFKGESAVYSEYCHLSMLVSASLVLLLLLTVRMAVSSAHSVTLPSRSSSSWPTSSWRCTTHHSTMGHMCIHVGGKQSACVSAPPAACRSSSGPLWPSARKLEHWKKWVSALKRKKLSSCTVRFAPVSSWRISECVSPFCSVFWKRFDLSIPGGLTTPTSVQERRKSWHPRGLTLRTLLRSQTWTSLRWHGRLGAKRDGADRVLITAQWRMAVKRT